MNLLAFDTSTDAMSVAVGRSVGGSGRVWQHQGAGGAQASATLLPAILDLMAQAQLDFPALDAIAFGCGPGAFTGLRTACSVAQGLALGSGARGREVPLLPVDSLLALAEDARHRTLADARPASVLALLDARMDEVYCAGYRFDGVGWLQELPTLLARPEDLAPLEVGAGPAWLLAGNAFEAYGNRLPFAADLPRIAALPDAVALLRLAPALLAQGRTVPAELALPTYIRDKVAQTTSERAHAKAAAQPLPNAKP